jgi:hypothetical protein
MPVTRDSFDAHEPFPDGRRNSVVESIFDQRLQYELRNHGIEHGLIDGFADFQTVAEADAHYLEIMIGEKELIAKSDLIFAAMFEREPQEIAEPHEHSVRGLYIAMH